LRPTSKHTQQRHGLSLASCRMPHSWSNVCLALKHAHAEILYPCSTCITQLPTQRALCHKAHWQLDQNTSLTEQDPSPTLTACSRTVKPVLKSVVTARLTDEHPPASPMIVRSAQPWHHESFTCCWRLSAKSWHRLCAAGASALCNGIIHVEKEVPVSLTGACNSLDASQLPHV
jgi:hypothetical protein